MLVPSGMRRGILKRAISDFQRRGGEWTSKCDNIRGTSIVISLKRDEIVQVGRLTGCENCRCASKRNQFLLYALNRSSIFATEEI